MKYYNRFNAIPQVFRNGSALLNIFPCRNITWVKKTIYQKQIEKLKSLMKDPSPNNLFMAATVFYSDNERGRLFSNPVETPFRSPERRITKEIF
jgi:hypothetical protein